MKLKDGVVGGRYLCLVKGHAVHILTHGQTTLSAISTTSGAEKEQTFVFGEEGRGEDTSKVTLPLLF